jgi:hypothetical protein
LDAIEHALMVAAYRQANGSPPPQSPPVEPALDCLCEALEHTCRLYGIDDAKLGAFLLSLALRVRRLAGETHGRERLRLVELQLQALLQLQPEHGAEQRPDREPPDISPPATGPHPGGRPPAGHR